MAGDKARWRQERAKLGGRSLDRCYCMYVIVNIKDADHIVIPKTVAVKHVGVNQGFVAETAGSRRYTRHQL